MHKPTSASTAGKHGYGTPAANSPPISRPLGPKYGLAARANQDTNKDSPFWEPPWELQSTNNTTCNTYAPNTTNSYNNFHTSKTCRRLGYSSSTAQAPVAYTNSGCCLPTSQPNSPKTNDAAVAACLSELLDAGAIPATSLAIAHLPLSQGGLGLTSASVTATPVHWASWADILPVLYNQMPQHAETLLHQLQHPTEAPPAVQAALTAANDLQEHGFAVPEWEALATGSTQSPPQPLRDGPTHHRGWQHGAVHAYHTSFEASLQPRLDPASQALLASQQGPHASRSFTTIPYNIDTHTFVPNPRPQTLATSHPPHSSSLPVPSHS